MPGLIQPSGMPGQGAAQHGGGHSGKTSVQPLFSTLFHGQAPLQQTLYGHNNHRIPATKPKYGETDKGDNVTQLLPLISPVPTVLPQLPPAHRVAVTTQGSPLLKTSVSTGKSTGLLPLDYHPQTLRELLSQHSGVLPQHNDMLSDPTLPQQLAETPSAVSAHLPVNKQQVATDRPLRERVAPPTEERTVAARQPVAVPAAIAVSQSSHQRPGTSELKTAYAVPLPMLASGPDLQSREVLNPGAAMAVATPDSPQWPEQLSQQVLIMHHKGMQSAELRLHPQELGNLKISLVIKSDLAEMTFISGHSQVRTAIEAALPHLKTALAENGISLGESHVGSDDSSSAMFNQSGGFGEQHHQTASSRKSFPGQSRGHVTLLSVEQAPSAASPSGRLDLFV